MHRSDDFVDQFSAHRSCAGAAEDFSAGRIGQQFHESIARLHDERFAVVVERITGGEIWNVSGDGPLFGEADGGDLWVGEYDLGHQAVIHLPGLLGVGDVMGSHLSLLHGNVDDFVRTRAIPCRVDVGLAGLHPAAGNDPAPFHRHPRIL